MPIYQKINGKYELVVSPNMKQGQQSVEPNHVVAYDDGEWGQVWPVPYAWPQVSWLGDGAIGQTDGMSLQWIALDVPGDQPPILRIYRYTDPSDWPDGDSVRSTTVPFAENNYSHSFVINESVPIWGSWEYGVEYFFRIAATGEGHGYTYTQNGHDGIISDEISGRRALPVPTLTLKDYDWKRLELEWGYSLGVGSFRIEISEDSEFDDIVLTIDDIPSGDTSLWTDKVLNHNIEYHVRIFAVDVEGTSIESPPSITVTGIPASKLQAITSTIVQDGANFIQSWPAVVSDQGSVRYQPEVNFTDGFTWYPPETTDVQYVWEPFGFGKVYEKYRVRAFVTHYVGSTTEATPVGHWATVNAVPIPGQPTITDTSYKNDSTTTSVATINWSSADADEYEYVVSTSSNFNDTFDSGNTASLTVDVSNLSHETTYYVRVRGVNGGQSGSWSPSKTITPRYRVDGETVITGVTTNVGGTSIDIDWSWDNNNQTKPDPDSWRIEFATNSGFTQNYGDKLVNGSQTRSSVISSSNDGITPGTGYHIRIMPIRAGVDGENYSNTEVSDGNIPIELSSVTGVTVNKWLGEWTELHVGWTTVIDANSYEVEHSTSPTFTQGVTTTESVNAPDTEVVLGNTFVEGTYYFRVRARNSSAENDGDEITWSNTVTYEVVDPAEPEPEPEPEQTPEPGTVYARISGGGIRSYWHDWDVAGDADEFISENPSGYSGSTNEANPVVVNSNGDCYLSVKGAGDKSNVIKYDKNGGGGGTFITGVDRIRSMAIIPHPTTPIIIIGTNRRIHTYDHNGNQLNVKAFEDGGLGDGVLALKMATSNNYLIMTNYRKNSLSPNSSKVRLISIDAGNGSITSHGTHEWDKDNIAARAIASNPSNTLYFVGGGNRLFRYADTPDKSAFRTKINNHGAANIHAMDLSGSNLVIADGSTLRVYSATTSTFTPKATFNLGEQIYDVKFKLNSPTEFFVLTSAQSIRVMKYASSPVAEITQVQPPITLGAPGTTGPATNLLGCLSIYPNP